MATKTEPTRESDLIVAEWDQRKSREEIEVSAGTYAVGDILDDVEGDLVSSTPKPAFDDAICLVNLEVEDGETATIPVLVRDAIVNYDAIQRLTGTDESDEELNTRLTNLLAQGIVFVPQPDATETGVS